MIRHIENKGNFALERDNSTRSAMAFSEKPIEPSTIIPEMHGYSNNGFSVSSPSNNISQPVYNAFNTFGDVCNLGSFNEVRTIEFTLPRSTTLSAIQLEISGNIGVFGVEISALVGANSWSTIGSYCIGASSATSYQDFVATDSLINFSQPIQSPNAFLFVRDAQPSKKFRILFTPYNSTSTLLLIQHISVMEKDCVEYLRDNLEIGWGYNCETFDTSFSTLGNLPCLALGNSLSSFGYLSYASSTIGAMEEFSLCFAFFPTQIAQHEKYGLFSRTSKAMDVWLDASALFVESNGAIASVQLPSAFFDNWHTLCVSYANSKICFWLDDLPMKKIVAEIDFSNIRTLGANFGCLLGANNEKIQFLRGGIRGVRFFNCVLNDFFAQTLYRSVKSAAQ